MRSRTVPAFWRALEALPPDIRAQARKAWLLFRENPSHPGLSFKRAHSREPIWSVRITRDYRALGVRDGDDLVWFWIGSHEAYERLLSGSA